MSRREKNLRTFGVVLLVGCSVLMIWGIVVVHEAIQTYRWVKVAGRIEHAVVEKQLRSGTSKYQSTYEEYLPVVEYSYKMNGKDYRSDRIQFFDRPSFPSRDEAQRFIDQLLNAKTAAVFVKPDNPSHSILVCGANSISYIPLALGFAGVVSGLILILKPEWV